MIPSLPFNLQQWIEQHRDMLRPPVCNKLVWEDQDFIVMVVGGPNQRSDYHYEEGPEFFYQVEGHMVLKIMQDGKPHDITIGEGEMFLLPPHIPHSPQRFADTVGLVIERKRMPGERDGLMWFCEHCHEKLYEEFFVLNNIETDLPPLFDHFFDSPQHRTCSQCGTVHPPRDA